MVCFKVAVAFDVSDVDSVKHNGGQFSKQVQAVHGSGSLTFLVGWFARGGDAQCIHQASTSCACIGVTLVGPFEQSALCIKCVTVCKADGTTKVLAAQPDAQPQVCLRGTGVYSRLGLPEPLTLKQLRRKHYVAAGGTRLQFELTVDIATDSFHPNQNTPDPLNQFTDEKEVCKVASSLFESVQRTTRASSLSIDSGIADCKSSANLVLRTTDGVSVCVHSDVLAASDSAYFVRLLSSARPLNSHAAVPLACSQLIAALAVIYLRTAPSMDDVSSIVSVSEAAHVLGVCSLQRLCDYEMQCALWLAAQHNITHAVQTAIAAFNRAAHFSDEVRQSAVRLLFDRRSELSGCLIEELRAADTDIYVLMANRLMHNWHMHKTDL